MIPGAWEVLRSDRVVRLLLFGGSLGYFVAVAAVVSVRSGAPLSGLGVFYDGHIYLEIARSFPLPYARAGIDYMGHAPGYPAVVWISRMLLPSAWLSWGELLLLAAWVPAALCTVLFHCLCREVGAPAFWGSVLFAVANPRWAAIAAAAHPEPLAMLFAMLALLACLRGALIPAVLWLSASGLTRYPALLLGLPVGWSFLITRRAWSVGRVAILTLPLVAFGLLNLYLHWRVPGFGGISEAHSVFWQTGLTWPFRELVVNADPSVWSPDVPLFEVTYAFVLLYAAALVVGLRPSQRQLWLLPVWVGTVVGVHVSLEGILGAWDFTRLAILAWPAAWLIVWQAVGRRVPWIASMAVAVACAAFAFWFAMAQASTAVRMQLASPVGDMLRETIEGLDGDEPRWTDFHARGGEPGPEPGPRPAGQGTRP